MLGLFPRKKEPSLNRPQSLAARVVRNPTVTSERRDDGALTLSVPVSLKRRYRLLAWFVGRAARQRLPSTRQLELDRTGSRVWELCDGKRSVQDVIRAISREYNLPRKEAEHSVTLFLKMLAQRRLVALDMTDVTRIRRQDKAPS